MVQLNELEMVWYCGTATNWLPSPAFTPSLFPPYSNSKPGQISHMKFLLPSSTPFHPPF